MSKPQFSILLPTHNRAGVLPFAIRSVLAQSVEDFELLIVGDGCTDNTADVITSFKDPRIRWFDLPKAAYFGYANRNIALRQAKGALIAFMAHDDLWLPDHLEILADAFKDKKTEIAYSRPVWVAPDGAIVPGTFDLRENTTLDAFLNRKRNGIPAGCVAHRRTCFSKYGYWNENLSKCGDWDLWSRIIEGGGRKNFAYLDIPTCLHFRAIWRTEANAGPPELKIWKEIHNLKNFIPSPLKFKVPENITEQEAFSNAISTNPGKWTQELRSAIKLALSLHVSEQDEIFIRLQERFKPFVFKSGPLNKIVQQLARELEEIEKSFSVKFSNRLRGVKNRIFHPGTVRGKIWLRLVKGR